jgi:TonB family protein
MSRLVSAAALSAALSVIAGPALADPPAAPATPAPAIHGQLQWSSTPTASDVSHYYPTRAQFEGVEGRGVISCTIAAGGALTNCSVFSEDPPQYGFGQAVLSMSNLFRVNMHSADPGVVIHLPMSFRVPQGETATPPAPPNALMSPSWISQPTPADLAAGAPVSREGGRALMDCVFDAQGGVTGCHAVAEVPAGGGFGAAAVGMASHYRITPTTPSGASVAGTPVRISVTFPSRAR